jgi:hypothetical protein
MILSEIDRKRIFSRVGEKSLVRVEVVANGKSVERIGTTCGEDFVIIEFLNTPSAIYYSLNKVDKDVLKKVKAPVRD